MASFYDDNFGEWEIQDDDDIVFYHHLQKTNVRKRCKGCDRWVNIQPHYAYCNSCAERIERGEDF